MRGLPGLERGGDVGVERIDGEALAEDVGLGGY